MTSASPGAPLAQNRQSTGQLTGAAVEFKAVARSFPETGAIVEGLNLNIEPGEFVALLGPSGCGKSTLLRLAAGLDEPTAGQVLYRQAGPVAGQRGFVFQDACLLPWRTALDNAALPLELLGHPKRQARVAAREVLERVGLGDALDRHPAQLSGGMRMRVSLARALVAHPSLLLLDEPFSALDESTRHALQEDLHRLWELSGMTVIFVTHSVSEAAFLAERTIALAGRPAQIRLDRRNSLASVRTAQTRLSPEFLNETKMIYEGSR